MNTIQQHPSTTSAISGLEIFDGAGKKKITTAPALVRNNRFLWR